MNLIQSLRQRFGLSQYDLARLTGLSRSLLSLASLQTREIPDAASNYLVALHETFDGDTPIDALETISAERREANRYVVDALETRAAECERQANHLEEVTRRQQADIELAWRRLHGFRVFRQRFAPIRTSGDLFLQIQEDKLDSFLSKDRLLDAEERAIRAELGRAEASIIRARIEKLKKN